MRRVFATVAAIALAVVAWGVISPTHRPEPTVSESVVPVAFVQSQPDGAMASAPIPSLGDIVGVTWEGRSPDAAEFARHYQLSASLGGGRTSGVTEWTHVQLGIVLTAIAY